MTLIAETLGGHYRLVRLIGRGGMSDVYEALDVRTGVSVAIKVVRGSDPEFVQRLSHEARALESFSHPGLVRLFDTGLAGDQAYLVMEYIDGITLAELLRQGPLSAAETAALGATLADALEYVHERGIVHRDVKPSNILRTTSGTTMLGDFGIAQLRDAATLTITGTMLGTVSYMAPEQLEDNQVGPSADLWSLGIVLLECLTGRRVYEGSPSEIVARRLMAPVPLPVDLPVPWKLVLTGMLDHRPDQRLTGRQVAAMLATTAFQTPWLPSNDDTIVSHERAAPYDLTALAPTSGDGSRHDDTIVAGADSTRVLRPTATRTRPNAPLPGIRRARAVLTGLVVVALVGIGLGLWLTWGGGHDPKKPPTTTTLPSVSTALSSLVSDMARAQSAGRMNTSSEQSIATNVEQAAANQSAGNLTQAGIDLAKAESTIVNGLQSATITQAESAQLLHALSVLSTSLDVTIPPTTTTTTTSTTTTTTTTPTTTTTLPGFGGPGNGNGNGNGNGF